MCGKIFLVLLLTLVRSIPNECGGVEQGVNTTGVTEIKFAGLIVSKSKGNGLTGTP